MSDTEMVFNLFVGSGGNLDGAENIGNAMRAAGVAPTDEELQELAQSMDLPAFEAACGAIPVVESSELLAAFEVFDQQGNGYMGLEELVNCMKNLGEGMDDAMIAKMKVVCEPDSEGQVNLRHFVDVLCKGL